MGGVETRVANGGDGGGRGFVDASHSRVERALSEAGRVGRRRPAMALEVEEGSGRVGH